jgi:hypothetical protein
MMNVRFLLIAVMAAPLFAASPPVQPYVVNPMTPLTRADFIERLERFYRVIDTKAQGYFTAAELTLPGYQIAYPPVPYFPVHGAQAPFRCVDADRDGRITHAEYAEYGVRAFDAAARNRLLLWGDLISLGRAIESDTACK